MAPSLLAAVASPFLLHGAAASRSSSSCLGTVAAAAPGRRAASALRVRASIKCDPSKVIAADLPRERRLFG
jgi:hypothetical protein